LNHLNRVSQQLEGYFWRGTWTVAKESMYAGPYSTSPISELSGPKIPHTHRIAISNRILCRTRRAYPVPYFRAVPPLFDRTCSIDEYDYEKQGSALWLASGFLAQGRRPGIWSFSHTLQLGKPLCRGTV
jgi:hypothetical protein